MLKIAQFLKRLAKQCKKTLLLIFYPYCKSEQIITFVYDWITFAISSNIKVCTVLHVEWNSANDDIAMPICTLVNKEQIWHLHQICTELKSICKSGLHSHCTMCKDVASLFLCVVQRCAI